MKNNQENNRQRAKAVESLTESEELMRFIVKHDPNAIAIFDAHLHYIAVSERYLADYQVKEAAVIGKHHYEVFPEMPQHWKEVHQRCLAGAIESSEDDFFKRPDGSVTYTRWECRPWRKINGQIGGIIIYSEVTTDRKTTEKALLESEIKYCVFFENSIDAILLTSPDGQTYSANLAACTLFGYSEEELIRLGRSAVEDLTDPRLSVLLAERKLYGKARGEVTFLRKDGTRFAAEISSSVFQNNEGLDRTSMIIRDVTERKNTEIALKQSEEKFRSYIDNSPDGVFVTDLQGRYVDVNSSACRMSGYSKNELLNMSFADILDPESLMEGSTQYQHLIQEGSSKVELAIKHKNGSVRWWYIDGVMLSDTRILAFVKDTTANKNIQNELKFQADLLSQVGQAVMATDLQGRVTYWNAGAERIYGWTSAEAMGQSILTLTSAEASKEKAYELMRQLKQGQTWSGELMVKSKDGRNFLVDVTDAPILDANGKLIGVIGISSDITERKKGEETLHTLSSAVEQTMDSIVITDHLGTIQYVNPAFELITGYSSEEAVGQTPRILKSGTNSPEYYQAMWDILLTGKVFKAEMVNRKKNGELYYVQKTIAPIVDKNGIITHFVGTGVDVSERKSAEQELIKAKEKAEESDRLKSAFLANMSHEVRTPLNSIIGFSELLADPDFEPEQKNEFIHHIVTNGNQLLRIISDIMDISKMESGKITIRKTRVNADSFMVALGEQFSFLAAAKNLELQLILPDTAEEMLLVTDTDRLNQVFSNLISNALKFTPNGQITIGFHSYGQLIEFYVRDTGIGIPEKYQAKIFDRFRQVEDTITRTFGGNGLGLAISKNLVELMGGTIRVESETGKGSTFYFTIPAG